MDTKINCGIIIVIEKQQNKNNDEFYTFINNIITNGKSVGTKNDLTNFCLSIGLMHIINKIEFYEINRIQILDNIISNIIQFTNNNSNEIFIVLGTIRGILQLTKLMLQSNDEFLINESENECKHLQNICINCLNIILSLIEYQIDIFRYVCSSILLNFIQLSYKHPNKYKFIIDKLFKILLQNINVNSIDDNDDDDNIEITKINLIILEKIANIYGTKYIYLTIPNIHKILIKNLTNTYGFSCYEQLMVSSTSSTSSNAMQQIEDLEIIYKNWIQPLLYCKFEFTNLHNANNIFSIYQKLITKAFKKWPQLITDYIFNEDKTILSDEMLLFLMWIIRSNDIKVNKEWIQLPRNKQIIYDAMVIKFLYLLCDSVVAKSCMFNNFYKTKIFLSI